METEYSDKIYYNGGVSLKNNFLHQLKNTGLILLASVIYAVGISLFLDPNKLAPGGVSGIAIIINHMTGMATGTMILLMNIPIMIAAILKFGFKLFFSTIYCLVISSLFINLLAPIGPLTTDPLLAAVAGAVLVGFALGVIFRAGATTGGADILVKLLRLRFKHIKTGVIFLISDCIVVAASGIVFKDINSALYAGIAVLIQSFILDAVLYGADGARILYIISDDEEKIAQRFMKELDVGVTYLNGYGAYTKSEKKVMLCAMRKQLLPQAREIVRQEDEEAFMIISSANQIFGEGFKRHDSEDL